VTEAETTAVPGPGTGAPTTTLPQTSTALVILDGHPVIHYDSVRVPLWLIDTILWHQALDLQVRYQQLCLL
jgi:hypothetical protein